MSDVLVLRLHGELDVAAVHRIRARCYAAVDDLAPAVVDVDLTDVTFADAAFLGLLVGLSNRPSGPAVHLRGPAPAVVRILAVSGLRGSFPDACPGSPARIGAVLDLGEHGVQLSH